ncbi:hypothetical protein GCM10023185_13980 [Hymenobacter saemangeumensis]|uniref:Tetratricopeptide repeat protein n=1 Tax=Hymenobacter saemangeumensis TaxID=1084522 RepID=A0ABP8I8F4_9BACT
MSAVLDDLFDRLRAATSPVEIEALQDAIWQHWLSTGQQHLDKALEAGMRALQAEDYTAAIAEFNQIIQLAPQLAEGWNKRATAYYLRGEYRAALSDIAAALQREPRHFGALWGQFRILEHLGETRRALAILNRLDAICSGFYGLRELQLTFRERLGENDAID